MLTRDRPAMANRAVECFRRQTYERKFLYVFDTSTHISPLVDNPESEAHSWDLGLRGKSIGALRNVVNAVMLQTPILIHWDDDDWSHPNRIAEQVALLQSSGADAVGYREMLFWRQRVQYYDGVGIVGPGQAWLFASQSPKPYALGTSLCYWRKTWEAKPFPEVIQPHGPSVNWGEDTAWCRGLKIANSADHGIIDSIGDVVMHPPMIASIHGGNTSPAYSKLDPPEWKRVPQWDDYCMEAMRL
jgi:hypothetical protein